MTTKVTNEVEKAARMDELEKALSREDKQEITFLLEHTVALLGSARKAAARCGVSPATVSQVLSNSYITEGDAMWLRIGRAVGWARGGWVFAETTNSRIVTGVLSDAQRQSLFIPISYNAGSGKTTGIKQYLAQDNTKNVYHIICRDWTRKEFFIKLRQSLGLNLISAHVSLDEMLEQIIHFFKMRRGKPLLIFDQANSLKSGVMRNFIHLFNEFEDQMGVALIGTEQLKKDIQAGARCHRDGYDEIDSRFGRNYVTLIGNTKKDVKAIANANGVTDDEAIEKIWLEGKPIIKQVMNGDGEKMDVRVIEDGRRIKRSILKHKLLTQINDL